CSGCSSGACVDGNGATFERGRNQTRRDFRTRSSCLTSASAGCGASHSTAAQHSGAGRQLASAGRNARAVAHLDRPTQEEAEPSGGSSVKRRPLAVVAAALSLGLLAATADAAEPATPAPSSGTTPPTSTADKAVAEMLFFTARGMMEAGRFAEACTKLAESYRLDPAAGTLLNLAVCHESEGRVASAWGEFRQALSDARKANRTDREELAKNSIAKLEPELPFLTIVVPDFAKVKDLEILRNGVALGAGGWGTELPIDPGKVEIVARAPGFLPKTKTITIQKKQHLSATIEKLDPAPVVETVAVG